MLNKKEVNWWFKFKMSCEDVGEFALDSTYFLMRAIIVLLAFGAVVGVLLSPFAVLKYLFF